MLRGSFSLVLTEQQLDFFDSISKQAFIEITSNELYTISSKSATLNTIHLTTDPGKIQNKRAGACIIKNIETGICIVGQTKDLRKRFNQYTSRSSSTSPAFMKINTININFYNAAQK